MKKIALLTAVSAAVLLTACGGEKPDSNAAQPVYDCVFPNTNSPAPGWVCDEPVPGIEVSAVGVAGATQAGPSYQKDIAALDARGRLAEQMQVQVQKMVKQYVGTTGKGDAETVDAVGNTTARSVTKQSLVGSKIYKSRTGPNGEMYVLLGLDANNVAKITEQAVKTSMKNDHALWQQFKAKQSFDEMAAEIAKQDVN